MELINQFTTLYQTIITWLFPLIGAIAAIVTITDSKLSKIKKAVIAIGLMFAITIVIIFSIIISSFNSDYSYVPDLIDRDLRYVTQKIQEVGLTYELEEGCTYADEYKVVYASYNSQDLVPKGTKIILKVDNPKSYIDTSAYSNDNIYNNSVVVPNVIGMEQFEAVQALHLNGLKYQVHLSGNGISDKYYIIGQSYQPNSVVDAGTVVSLELSPNLPESGATDYSYEINDDEVKTADELKGFYLKTVSTTNGSFYNAETNSTTVLDYIPVKLCHVIFNVTGSEDSILSISMIDKNTGLCIDNDNGKSELYINKGEYTIMADFGDYSKTVNINITGSGEYDITF